MTNNVEAYKGVYAQDVLQYIQDMFVMTLSCIFVDFAKS